MGKISKKSNDKQQLDGVRVVLWRIAPDNNVEVLFQKRDRVDAGGNKLVNAGAWCLPGRGSGAGENVSTTAGLCMTEELGLNPIASCATPLAWLYTGYANDAGREETIAYVQAQLHRGHGNVTIGQGAGMAFLSLVRDVGRTVMGHPFILRDREALECLRNRLQELKDSKAAPYKDMSFEYWL